MKGRLSDPNMCYRAVFHLRVKVFLLLVVVARPHNSQFVQETSKKELLSGKDRLHLELEPFLTRGPRMMRSGEDVFSDKDRSDREAIFPSPRQVIPPPPSSHLPLDAKPPRWKTQGLQREAAHHRGNQESWISNHPTPPPSTRDQTLYFGKKWLEYGPLIARDFCWFSCVPLYAARTAASLLGLSVPPPAPGTLPVTTQLKTVGICDFSPSDVKHDRLKKQSPLRSLFITHKSTQAVQAIPDLPLIKISSGGYYQDDDEGVVSDTLIQKEPQSSREGSMASLTVTVAKPNSSIELNHPVTSVLDLFLSKNIALELDSSQLSMVEIFRPFERHRIRRRAKRTRLRPQETMLSSLDNFDRNLDDDEFELLLQDLDLPMTTIQDDYSFEYDDVDVFDAGDSGFFLLPPESWELVEQTVDGEEFDEFEEGVLDSSSVPDEWECPLPDWYLPLSRLGPLIIDVPGVDLPPCH